jgi:hypothetical protein
MIGWPVARSLALLPGLDFDWSGRVCRPIWPLTIPPDWRAK